MPLTPDYNRVRDALLEALHWIHTHEYFIVHTFTVYWSLSALPAGYLPLHMQSADTQGGEVFDSLFEEGLHEGRLSMPLIPERPQ